MLTWWYVFSQFCESIEVSILAEFDDTIRYHHWEKQSRATGWFIQVELKIKWNISLPLCVQRLHGWKLPILLTQVSYPKTPRTCTFDVVEPVWKEKNFFFKSKDKWYYKLIHESLARTQDECFTNSDWPLCINFCKI